MTLEQAIDIVYDEATHQGEPLTRDVAEAIVSKLFAVSALDVTLQAGDFAKLYRERYEGEPPHEKEDR